MILEERPKRPHLCIKIPQRNMASQWKEKLNDKSIKITIWLSYLPSEALILLSPWFFRKIKSLSGSFCPKWWWWVGRRKKVFQNFWQPSSLLWAAVAGRICSWMSAKRTKAVGHGSCRSYSMLLPSPVHITGTWIKILRTKLESCCNSANSMCLRMLIPELNK